LLLYELQSEEQIASIFRVKNEPSKKKKTEGSRLSLDFDPENGGSMLPLSGRLSPNCTGLEPKQP
jgi:hypothetical protein